MTLFAATMALQIRPGFGLGLKALVPLANGIIGTLVVIAVVYGVYVLVRHFWL